MSKLRQKLALDQSYLSEPEDIQLDMVILPYLEQVAQVKANEIGFPFSGAVVDEIYKDLISNYGISKNSTLVDIQNAVGKASTKWQEEIGQQNQTVAKR